MKTLTRFEAKGIEELLSAIPYKKGSERLSGKTMAALALTMAALSKVNAEFMDVARDIAEKVKPEDYDANVAKRQEALKTLFPEGTQFDASVWADKCPDKDFEKVYNETEQAFASAYNEAGNEKVEVNIKLTEDHLADISNMVANEDTVTVGERKIPVNAFITALAMLID